MITEEKIIRYFYRLNKESQDLILYEMVSLYHSELKDKRQIIKSKSRKNYRVNGKIIFVDFQKK